MRDISRRELLQNAGVAVAASGLLPVDAVAKPRRRRRARTQVAVLGGGMAGLAAAHELAERGFKVTVYERNALGGKARSIPVAGTAAGGRRHLPGEHGFRFFPGFYHHVPDTMRRIPFAGNEHGVGDNLVAASGGRSPRTNGRPDGQIFGVIPDPVEALSLDGLRRILTEELVKQQGVRVDEVEFFVNRLLVFLTSSDERRFGQWEKTSWWDFVRAEGKSDEYRKVIASGLTRTVVAAKETVASTRTIGNMAEAFVMNIMGRGNDGALDRVLNAPTNEAWIDPWILHLRSLGVQFRVGHTVDSLRVRGGRIASALMHDRRARRHEVEADWFISAMPAERARRLWSPAVLAVDPSLKAMDELFVDWMVGIQFFLRRPLELTHGHVTFVDAPWALTALTQGQFWGRRDFRRDYGDGSVVDCLSVDVSDWDSPGVLYKRPAKECTHAEIAREVWAQMKLHLEDRGDSVLPDDILHSSFLDPGVAWSKSKRRNRNETPLLVNTVGSWERRPKARCAVPNLFLAGDYVQTDIDLATMEGANESGARGRQRAARGGRVRRPTAAACTSCSTRRSSPVSSRSTPTATAPARRTCSTGRDRAGRRHRRRRPLRRGGDGDRARAGGTAGGGGRPRPLPVGHAVDAPALPRRRRGAGSARGAGPRAGAGAAAHADRAGRRRRDHDQVRLLADRRRRLRALCPPAGAGRGADRDRACGGRRGARADAGGGAAAGRRAGDRGPHGRRRRARTRAARSARGRRRRPPLARRPLGRGRRSVSRQR